MGKFGDSVAVAVRAGQGLTERLAGAMGRRQGVSDAPSQLRVGIWSSAEQLAVVALDIGGEEVLSCVVRECPEKLQPAMLASIAGSYSLERHPAFIVLDKAHYQTFVLDVAGLEEEELGHALQYRVQALIEHEADQISVAGHMMPARSGVRSETPMALATAADRTHVERLVYMAEASGLKVSGVYSRESVMCDVGRRLDSEGQGVLIASILPTGMVLTATQGGVLRMARHLSFDQSRPVLDSDNLQALAGEMQRSIDYFDRRLSSTPLEKLFLTPDSIDVDELSERLTSRLTVAEVSILNTRLLFTMHEPPSAEAEANPEGIDSAYAWLAAAAALPRHSDSNISLYQQPATELDLMSPRTLILANVAALILFILASTVQSWMIDRADARLVEARQSHEALKVQLDQLATEEELEAREPSQELIVRLNDTRWLRDFYRSLLADFEAIDLGVAEGFSGPLIALSEVLVGDLWVESVRLETDAATISGKAFKTVRASEFSRRLNEAREFSRWDLVELRVDDPSSVEGQSGARGFTLTGGATDNDGRRFGRELEGVPNRLFEMLQNLRGRG